jgi:DNA polymerase I-like protein with 3'-5' exonuclease and polymerase domains
MSEHTTNPEFTDDDIVGKNPDEMKSYRVVYTAEEALEYMQHDEVIGFDIETTGFSFISDKPALIQMYGQQTGTVWLSRCVYGRIDPKLLDFMHTSKAKFVGHNIANFDIPFMYHSGLTGYRNIDWFDTILAEALLVGINRRTVKKNLAASIRRRLGMTIDKDIEHSNWAAETLTDKQVEYAVQDVVHLPALMEVQILKAFESEQHEALELEMQLASVVATMRINGLPINRVALDDFIAKQHVLRDEATIKFAQVFPGVNPRSPVKLKEALKHKGVIVKSTDKETMQKLLHFGRHHESQLAEVILNYRTPDTLIKFYGGDWADKYIEVDGRVHPNIWTCMTDTTRLSSSHPNGQQFPGSMRSVFAADPGFKYVSPDYSQLEIRVAADVSDDKALQEAFKLEDVHTAIAAQVFNKPPSKVTTKERKVSKAMVFTLLFGGQSKTLYNYSRAQGSDMTIQDAQKNYEAFFTRFSALADFHQWARNMAQKKVSFLRLPYGYRRILDRQRNRAPIIINTLVQGPAAVGTKLAMIEMEKQGVDKYLGMQLHDEFIAGIVPSEEAEDYSAAMSEIMVSQMSSLMQNNTPIVVEGQIGDTWGG